MNNPIVKEIIQMRMRGMSPMQAKAQLMQKYSQFGQAAPFAQANTPQQIDAIARNTAQSMGLNPNQILQGLMYRR